MGKQEAKALYVPFFPIAKNVPEWYKNFNFNLVESMQDLEESFKDWKPDKTCFMSFDTETTGLDHEECSMVGYSYCLDGKNAYYVPVYHFEYEGNLGEEAVTFIYLRMCEARMVFMFNARFDVRIVEYFDFASLSEEDKKKRNRVPKYNMSVVETFDVSIPCWLADTNLKLPSLKNSSENFLGFKMMHFGEVTEKVENFFYTNPKSDPNVPFYAGSDALCTFLLVPATMKYFKEGGFASKMDNKMLYPLMNYEHEKIWLNKEMLQTIMNDLTERIDECEKEVYDEFGYQINLNSPQQVSQAFQRLGIDTGGKTASGFMKTGIEDLENLSEELKERYPALKAFVDYKTLFKLRSSYVAVLLKEAESKGYIRCSYKTQQVPTGRLASGKDGKNGFFSPINIQSMPKPHVLMHEVYDLHDRTLFSNKNNIILGYEFIPESRDANGVKIEPVSTDGRTYMGMAEGMRKKLNVRACCTPKMYEDSGEDEFIWMACDYSAQELRIPANLSRESVWCTAFASPGGDVHKSTACSIWGEENYNKDFRKMAKGANFSILYGAEAQSFANDPSYNMSPSEAEEFYQKYKNALPTLFQWEERLQKRGRRDGFVSTYFGRPRRVKGYFEKRQFAFANRTIVNTVVQGTASDILKIVLCKLWVKLLHNPEYINDVAWRTTIHDEIDYNARCTRANEIGRIIETTQRFTLPEWQVPIDVELSMGWNMGSLFAVEYDEEIASYKPKLV